MKPFINATFGIFTVFAGTTAFAQDNAWMTNRGLDPRGNPYARMFVKKNELGMEFNCNKLKNKSSFLRAKFSAISLPRLYAVDGEEAKLRLVFKLKDGVTHIVPWDAYFVSDVPDGSGAWLGKFSSRKSDLNALSAARKIIIINKDGERVYDFDTRRTAIGVKAIREECGLGK